MGGSIAGGKVSESEETLVDLSTPCLQGKSNAGDVTGQDKGSDQRWADGKQVSGTMVGVEVAAGKSYKNSMNSGGIDPNAINDNEQGA
ncbi:hypothetical protein RIF29_15400 [Crotalaria pallida]|uniref:Uncharacterized protein n=1 Tax=Crotalaria pallida TaxID=3830 RepID=A0AAN9FD34_CROPI